MRRVIDGVTDALGHEFAFTFAVVAVVVWLLVGVVYGLDAGLISLIMNVLTFMMVFAVQHTSSRESRALNLKMDELIRATEARNDLIGVESESHGELDERREQLLDESAQSPDSGRTPAGEQSGPSGADRGRSDDG